MRESPRALRRRARWRCCRKTIATDSSGRPRRIGRRNCSRSTIPDFSTARAPFRAADGRVLPSPDRRTFPLVLEFAREPARALRCSAMPRRRCIPSPAGIQCRAARRVELAQIVLDSRRDGSVTRRCSGASLRGRRTDRMAGIAFTHGLVRLFGTTCLVRWPRGLALTLLDSVAGSEARIHTRNAVRCSVAAARASPLAFQKACHFARRSAK